MAEPLDIANLYFKLSNKSDLNGIAKLFTDSTKYVSINTGEYIGKNKIMNMQRQFHDRFSSLEWIVNSAKEIRPGFILFDYSFIGILLNGDRLESSGLEYLTVRNGKIDKVEIRNKS